MIISINPTQIQKMNMKMAFFSSSCVLYYYLLVATAAAAALASPAGVLPRRHLQQEDPSSFFDEAKFDALIAKMEGDVREFAQQVEKLYEFRCDQETMTSCQNANYNNCRSLFPNQVCPGGPNLHVDACGDASTSSCSALWDFTVSATWIPNDLADGKDGNPTDPKVIETVCFTRALDEWFIEKRDRDLSFWQDDFGVDEGLSMYFGSHNGAFRIFPARHTDNCGEFDARVRPWYVAGSSGPKNIILILDVSGSIDEIRLPLLKKAAIRVVETLTVQDRITVIPFSTSASKLTTSQGYMYRATTANKAILTNEINQLKAGGGTNFYQGFEEAFNVLDATITQEFHADCNSAVLFFTDGERNGGPDETQVTRLVQERIAAAQDKMANGGSRHPMLLFAYSISQDNKVHQFPADLSCAVETGVWSRISNDDEIIDSLSSYYQLFSLGVGSDRNQEFVAWVEPYEFVSRRMGTTVSMPVYDRSQSPHLFLGVVGVDIPIAALDAALGGGDAAAAREESIRRVVSSSRASCPTLDLTPCEVQSFRRWSTPDGSADCIIENCTDSQLLQVTEEECPGRSDYPTSFWANQDVLGLDYESTVCCEIGQTSASDTCAVDARSNPENSDSNSNSLPPKNPNSNPNSLPLIIGLSVGAVAWVGLGLYIYVMRSRAKLTSPPQGSRMPKQRVPDSTAPLPPPISPAFQVNPSAPYIPAEFKLAGTKLP